MTDYKENFEHLSPVWTHYSDVIVDHGEGTYLYATDGRKFIDFTCGIGVTNTGHCHPKVVEAIRNQAGFLAAWTGKPGHSQTDVGAGGGNAYHRPAQPGWFFLQQFRC